MSEDPFGTAGGLNLYASAADDPIDHSDPPVTGGPISIPGPTVWADPTCAQNMTVECSLKRDDCEAQNGIWNWNDGSCTIWEDVGNGPGAVSGGGGGDTGPGVDIGAEAVRACRLAIAQTAIDVFATGAAVLGGAAVVQALERSAANLAEYGSLTLRAGVMTAAASGARTAACAANRLAWQNAVGAGLTVGNANLISLGVQAARGQSPNFLGAVLGSLPGVGAFVGAIQVFNDVKNVFGACNPK